MYISEATLTNFRGLQVLPISFEQGSKALDFPNVTLIVGRNGSGKTSILRGLAIGLIGWALEGYRSYYNVHHGAMFALIDLFVEPSSKNENVLCRGSRKIVQEIKSYGTIEKIADKDFPTAEFLRVMRDELDPRLFIAGYGASRQVELREYDAASRRQLRHARYARVASLLDAHYTLVPFGSWVPKLEKKNREQVAQIINGLMPAEALKFDPGAKDELYFLSGKNRLPFAALSDGYQAFLGWVGDLLYHLNECSTGRTSLDKMTGIVLVDEIDLHLHPRWQQEVVGKLARAFPKLQFILTTHSPLVVGSVQAKNVRVLQESKGEILISTLDQEVRGLTSDQVLLSPSFGLTTVREAEFMKQLAQTEQRARAGDPHAALEFNRMVAYGAGNPPAGDDIPDWVREAIKRKKRAKGGKS